MFELATLFGLLDFTDWIENAGAVLGLVIIGSIIFAESGLLIGFFLPGDTLLFSAGFFAASGKLPLAGVLAVIFLCAVLGDNTGYEIGKRTGPRLFKKKDGLIFRQEYLLQAEKFYEKHGGKTMIFARFVPVVRTFAPMVAGIGRMPRRKFVMYDIAGAAFWTLSIVLAGYWLGSLVDPKVMERYLILAVGAAMVISFGPTLLHLLKNKKLMNFLKRKAEKEIKETL
jgi:membrane-associated protein